MIRRVLHVIPFLWSGAGRVVTRLCEEQARDADVHIATAGRANGQTDWAPYRRRLRRGGIQWHRLNTFDRSAASLWPTLAETVDLVRALRPDVIHAHAGVPTLLSTMAVEAAGSHARVVGQMYSWGPNRPGWMDTMDLAGFARADRVVVSARRYERTLLDGGVDRRCLVYIPWGVDAPPPRRRIARGRVRRLGFVGRIEPRKDQVMLVEAFARARVTMPDTRLVLVGPDGDASYANEVRHTVERLGLEDVVDLTGPVRSIWPWLARLDLFVSLSCDEGQGLAVLEAMAAGIPVLAKPAAGLEDFLVDGVNGLWLRGDGAGTISTEIVEALSSQARIVRLALQARRMVARRYTWPATMRALGRVYGWGNARSATEQAA